MDSTVLVDQLGDFAVVGLGEFGLNHVNGNYYQAQMRAEWRADLSLRRRSVDCYRVVGLC